MGWGVRGQEKVKNAKHFEKNLHSVGPKQIQSSPPPNGGPNHPHNLLHPPPGGWIPPSGRGVLPTFKRSLHFKFTRRLQDPGTHNSLQARIAIQGRARLGVGEAAKVSAGHVRHTGWLNQLRAWAGCESCRLRAVSQPEPQERLKTLVEGS